MISLLINTFDRYENLEKILDIQSKYDIIDEILVFNNGKQEKEYSSSKVKVIRASYDVGLRSRWILGALAKNNCLFVQDDDLIVPESVFKMIFGHFLFDPNRVYGIFGRQIDFDHSYDLNKLVYGEADLALTRLACFPKMLIPYILESEDRILPCRYPKPAEFPYDDILLSFTCLSAFNKKPFIVKNIDSVSNLDTDNQLHKNMDFMTNRFDIIKKCKEIICHETIHAFITRTAEAELEAELANI